MPTVLITGGTGLVGKAITKELLRRGYDVTILTRSKEKARPVNGVSYAAWDVPAGIINERAVAGADHIIHLAGAGVADKRWTDERKKEIVESRVKSGELICKALQKSGDKLKAFVSASAIGWYGPDPVVPNPNPFKETAPHAAVFLGTTCFEWERSVHPIKEMRKRLVLLRTGIVLSNRGGALKEFRKPLKFGLATAMGNGKQVVSWIHIDDLVNMYLSAMESEVYSGVYNAVAPSPVSNARLVMELAKQVKGSFYSKVSVPSPILKLMLGEMSVEVLKSTTVSAEKILRAGFNFSHPTIAAALSDLARHNDK